MKGNAATKSTWSETHVPQFRRVTRSQKFDVVVVGGGITGLTAGYMLKRACKKVCVLEREQICAVDTGHTTAHLTMVTDLRLSEQASHFGKDSARLAWLGGAAAINTIEKIVQALEINCEFKRVPGFLHASLDGSRDERKELKKEAELARELGFDAVYLDAVPHFAKPGIRFSNQAKFHPLKYLSALAEAVDGDGSAIFEHADVTEVKEDPYAAIVAGKTIRCDYLVIATHVPLMGKTGLVSATLLQTKLAPYTSYAVGAPLPKGRLPEASFWDTSDPYYYLRVDAGRRKDYAIFGGLDHKTGQETDTERRFTDLKARLYSAVPEVEAVDHQWSGQVIETNDGLPYIGETAERQFAATGFSGNGMTFGTLGAMMACDAALKRTNPWQNLFSVNRKKVRGGAWDYVKENFDFPYYLVRDRLTRAEGQSPREVKRGEGKVLNLDGQRVACHRDEEGKVSMVSAVCTHMGCLVHWNDAERTWDCSCHGSRFHGTGEVLAGPAETPLEAVGPVQESPVKPTPASARRKKPARHDSNGRKTDRRLAGRRSRQT